MTVPELSRDAKYGERNGTSILAKALAAYDGSDPRTARVKIVAGSDLTGTSDNFILTGNSWVHVARDINKPILNSGVVKKTETSCKPELLLFAGMNDHLHAAGLLISMRKEEPTSQTLREAVQALLSAMVELEKVVAVRLGSKIKKCSHRHVGMRACCRPFSLFMRCWS